MTRAAFFLAVIMAACIGIAHSAEAPRIAIIIDDLGYQLAAGKRAIALPGPVSYAILPGAPRARTLATSASNLGKEVLLHLPMQASIDDVNAEPVSMTLDMSRKHFAATFDAAMASVPNAVGVNNHRGSLITRHPGHMQWLMEEIHARDSLFFVDSYTTHESVALQLAAEAGVNAIRRDVFLDTDPKPATIRREFERLKSLAKRRGVAVGIGHPYQTTLAFLEAELPKLAEQGFELVTISELVLTVAN